MTAASMAGAIKAHLEGAGLGVAVYRDGAPADAEGNVLVPYPHVTVAEGVGYDVDALARGDDLPPGRAVILEMVQVDVWQHARATTTPSGRVVAGEAYALPEQIATALRDRALADHAPWHVYGVQFADGRRWPPSNGIVRHTFTIVVRRGEARRPAA